MDPKQSVRTFLEEILQSKGDLRGFSDSESLVASGRLASLDVLHIVLFLEERHSMDFSDGFDQNDMDSVDNIVALIEAQ